MMELSSSFFRRGFYRISVPKASRLSDPVDFHLVFPMTIEQYTPEKLDQLALRLLDLAAELRGVANGARQAGADCLPVHDKKALLWLDNLEQWAGKTRIGAEVLLRKK